MEASCSPLEETAMDTGFASSRAKSKAVLNRRPSGYWKVFSNWWRGRYAALKTRPTVHEVIEWYHRNAASSWPSGQVPCLKAVLRQSKGLRPIDGLKEYFREYRKKRKQQGGLALKAGEDASQRRSRPAKRRRGRSTHKDSSDDDEADEIDHEASAFSDHHSSDDDEEEEMEACPSSRQRMVGLDESDATAAEPCVADGSPFSTPEDGACRGMGAVHAVFEAWQHVGGGPAGTTGAVGGCPPSPLAADPMGTGLTGAPCASSLSYMPHAVSVAGDPVHPAVAPGMVPIAAGGGSPRAVPDMHAAQHAAVYGGCPESVAQYTFIPAVPVRRPPLRPVRAAACLPPLSSRAAAMAAAAPPATAPVAAVAAASPGAMKVEPGVQVADKEDDHAGDCCSTGGGAPADSQGDARYARAYVQERAFEGYGYEYPVYGPSPHACYPCHPHHPCCYRPPAYPMPYPYHAMSSASYPLAADCSSGGAGGGATSSFSPAAPWPAMATEGGMPYPQRQGSGGSCGLPEACFPHHRHSAWASWVAADGGGAWQGVPQYGNDVGPRCCPGRNGAPSACAYVARCTAGPGCPCAAHPEAARLHGCSGPCAHSHGACPVMPHVGFMYGGRQGPQLYPAGLEAWEVAPPAVPACRDHQGCVEGEACSSSVSEHFPHEVQEHGRWSPCSGTSAHGRRQASNLPGTGMRSQPQLIPIPMAMMHGHHHLHGHPAYYASARGLATAGSVTSMATLAPIAEESPFITPACADAGRRLHAWGFNGALHHGKQPKTVVDIVPAADAGVSPYLADAPPAPCASDAAGASLVQPEVRPEPQGPGPEGVDYCLGLVDSFGQAAREAIDHDLAFAWENFVAGDAVFEANLPANE